MTSENPIISGSVRVAKPASIIFQNPDHQVVMPTVLADVAFAMAMSQGDNSMLSTDSRRKIALKALDDVGMGKFAEVKV